MPFVVSTNTLNPQSDRGFNLCIKTQVLAMRTQKNTFKLISPLERTLAIRQGIHSLADWRTDGRVGRLADDGLKLTRWRTRGPAVAHVLHHRGYMAGSVIVTSSEGDGVGPRKLRENSSSNPVNFTRSHSQDKPWPKSLQ